MSAADAEGGPPNPEGSFAIKLPDSFSALRMAAAAFVSRRKQTAAVRPPKKDRTAVEAAAEAAPVTESAPPAESEARVNRGKWSSEEDARLVECVEKFGGKNWKEISRSMRGRTAVQCRHRWSKIIQVDQVKGPWTPEEDAALIRLVQQYGTKKWSEIAQHLHGRIGKQCRERYHNHLDEGVRKDPWTPQEDQIIVAAHENVGNKWSVIASLMRGRTDNAVKNHWNSTLKRRAEDPAFVISPFTMANVTAMLAQQRESARNAAISPASSESTSNNAAAAASATGSALPVVRPSVSKAGFADGSTGTAFTSVTPPRVGGGIPHTVKTTVVFGPTTTPPSSAANSSSPTVRGTGLGIAAHAGMMSGIPVGMAATLIASPAAPHAPQVPLKTLADMAMMDEGSVTRPGSLEPSLAASRSPSEHCAAEPHSPNASIDESVTKTGGQVTPVRVESGMAGFQGSGGQGSGGKDRDRESLLGTDFTPRAPFDFIGVPGIANAGDADDWCACCADTTPGPWGAALPDVYIKPLPSPQNGPTVLPSSVRSSGGMSSPASAIVASSSSAQKV